MKSGIYQIQNLINGKVYIGSAVNLKKRQFKHFTYLKGNYHHNNKLQRAFNKYGLQKFEFSVLEFVDTKNLIKHEQWYIDTFDAVNSGYNHAPIAGNCLGVKHSEKSKQIRREKLSGKNNPMFGKKHSDDFKKARKEFLTLNNPGKNKSEETKMKISQAKKGKSGHLHTEEYKLFMSNKMTEIWAKRKAKNV